MRCLRGNLPAKRSPAIEDKPPREDSESLHSLRTSVFVVLCELLKEHQDDADRLAILVATWTLAGYPSFNIMEVAPEKIDAALHRRNADKLRHQAEGMLLALELLAQDAEEMRRHRGQVEAGTRECHALSLAEFAARS